MSGTNDWLLSQSIAAMKLPYAGVPVGTDVPFTWRKFSSSTIYLTSISFHRLSHRLSLFQWLLESFVARSSLFVNIFIIDLKWKRTNGGTKKKNNNQLHSPLHTKFLLFYVKLFRHGFLYCNCLLIRLILYFLRVCVVVQWSEYDFQIRISCGLSELRQNEP